MFFLCRSDSILQDGLKKQIVAFFDCKNLHGLCREQNKRSINRSNINALQGTKIYPIKGSSEDEFPPFHWWDMLYVSSLEGSLWMSLTFETMRQQLQ